jgi:hypothetical protein
MIGEGGSGGRLLDLVGTRVGTGPKRVGDSHTAPAPMETVTATGTGPHRPAVPAVCYKNPQCS